MDDGSLIYKTTNMITTIERLEEIERERTEVMNNPAFRNWVSQLGVSSSYTDRGGIHKANDMMGSYDFGKYSKINLVESKIIRIFTK